MLRKPILYYAALSPPCRAVVMTSKEIGIELELKNINLLAADHLTPEFLKINPTHTIPTLDDNGVIIYDSHAIMTYLVDKYAKTDMLYPKDLIARAHVNERLYFDTGYLFARLRFIFEPVLYSGGYEIPQEKLDYIEKSFVLLEQILQKNNYLVGNSLTLGDLACISSIASIKMVLSIDAKKYPKLVEWDNRMSKLSYYEELNQKGADEFQEIFYQLINKNKKEKEEIRFNI